MSEVVGRAGFHATHTKNAAERTAILHEMMRELDEESINYWAARNPNIVVADEPLNEAMVNDGNGGFTRCTDRQDVLAYGDGRLARLHRKPREDSPNKKTGKLQGGTVTTTMIVAHLPKSLCREVPDYYPVLDAHGHPVLSETTGEPKRRSRWVARDRDEARKYFQDVIGYLANQVIPGGVDGVHGYDIQHSESTPHVQILADTFGEDPDNLGKLRADASRAWFAHRDVKDENGRQKTGRAKLRDYHAGLKAHLIDRGWDISPDFDEQRHLVGLGKYQYGQVMDAQRSMAEGMWDRDQDLRDYAYDLAGQRGQLKDQQAALASREAALGEREGILERREAELPRRRRAAAEQGHQEGRQAGYEAGRVAARAEAEEALQRYLDRVRSQPVPQLIGEFLDRQDQRGRSYRSVFDRFVDHRITRLARKHGVAGDGDLELELGSGDREQFIEDGGAQLNAEIVDLKRQRQHDRSYGD